MTNKYLADWLVVSAVSGLGPVRIQQLLEQYSISELRQVIETCPNELPLSVGLRAKLRYNPQLVEQSLQWQNAADDHHIICIDDEDYPPLLKQIADPPSLLFIKGRLETLSIPAIAIVGSRSATPTGLKLSYEFGQALAEKNIIIASGMAMGVDGAAHTGALAARNQHQLNTIAVVGTGVDVIYPNRHRTLYQDIVRQGCVVSEFWPSTPPVAPNFPKRNRIISGLSMGTLVVEAGRKSGSLITARLATEQDREVFAIPGSVLSNQSQGCHDLIKSGATLVTSIEDIFEELSTILHFHLEEVRSQHNINKEPQCNLPFESLLASVGYETTAIDVIVEHSGKTIDQVLEQLLQLELAGWIAQVPGGYVRLKRS